jgi:bifunctional DNase/RNase
VPEVTVVAVGLDPEGIQPVLLLREVGGRGRTVPVLVGLPEAGALEIQRRRVVQARPQTHELICDVIEACGRRLERVRITELRDGIYHAELVLDGDVRVSSRLTDAVALALRLDLTIEAEEDVLEAGHAPVAVVGADDDADPLDPDTAPIAPDEVDEFRRRLDDISPEDFED